MVLVYILVASYLFTTRSHSRDSCVMWLAYACWCRVHTFYWQRLALFLTEEPDATDSTWRPKTDVMPYSNCHHFSSVSRIICPWQLHLCILFQFLKNCCALDAWKSWNSRLKSMQMHHLWYCWQCSIRTINLYTSCSLFTWTISSIVIWAYQTEEPWVWPFYDVRPWIFVIIGAVSRRNVLQ